MPDYFSSCYRDHVAALELVSGLSNAVNEIADHLVLVLGDRGKLFFCGNGGSAADAQHLAAEFVGRFTADRPALPAISLSTDTSALTCIANDYSFDRVFARQVEALARPGDCLIGISTSGNSENLVEAFKTAGKLGVSRVGILGRDGGLLSHLSELKLIVSSGSTARIQEMHIFLGHVICGLVEQKLGLV